MKVGILCAMDQELALLKERIQLDGTHQHGNFEYIEGVLNGVSVVIVKCGIGKVASSVCTTLLIDHFNPDYVINSGSAGGFDTELNVGDVVVGTAVLHHDVDLTNFGYQLGQVAGGPENYPCDGRLVDAATRAAQKVTERQTKQGLICTGDAFIGTDEAAAKIKANFPEIAACEMEGAAIGQTCYLLDTPFLVIRSLSDIAGKESTVSFAEYIEEAGKNSAELVIAAIAELANL